MTAYLDLDKLPTDAPERVIVLNGERHEMKRMTVGDFIEQARASKEIAASVAATEGEQDHAAATESLVRLINSVFPTITPEMIRKMNFRHLSAIMDFITKRADEIVAENTGDDAKN